MDELLNDADLCVKCGLCLPHCPTYRQTGNENESPRGRIALIQAYAGGHLDATPELIAHIDHCLLCRACEKACPAEVPYGRLVDRFRARTRSRQPFSAAAALLKQIAAKRTFARWAQTGLQYYGMLSLKRFSPLRLLNLHAIDRLLPEVNRPAEPLHEYYCAGGSAKGDVGLFTGCMGMLLDHATVCAAIKCLTAAGFNVRVPAEQTCCGALAQHDGDPGTANRLAEINRRAFAEPALDTVVSIASGCGAHIREYLAREMADKITDVSRFLSRNADFSGLLKPLNATVCLHSPCSLNNVLREEQGALALLRQIPGLRIVYLPPTGQCCGAAGSYVLKHPGMAKALADEILNAACAAQADYLATSNIGCALHMAAGLRERDAGIRVVHPMALLAQQLR